MKKYSKRFRGGAESLEDKSYGLEEAVQVLVDFPKAKFDETVDLNFHLGIDTKKAEQQIRGSVSLPHGTGKSVKVLVFCRGEEAKEAQNAGADFVGADELIKKINDGWLDFDVVVAHPEMMKDISKLGRVLGPRNLMPSPKVGTVTKDLGRAVAEIKKGKIEYKSDKNGGVHVAVGKISFGKDKIVENLRTILKTIVDAKPQSSKGNYLRSIAVSTSMGPGIFVDKNSI